jgi:hypothetical protein
MVLVVNQTRDVFAGHVWQLRCNDLFEFHHFGQVLGAAQQNSNRPTVSGRENNAEKEKKKRKFRTLHRSK